MKISGPPGREFWTHDSLKCFSISPNVCSDRIRLFLCYPYALDYLYYYKKNSKLKTRPNSAVRVKVETSVLKWTMIMLKNKMS